jgi:ubiquinone biosynthesis protein
MFERTRRAFKIIQIVLKYHLIASLLGFYRSFAKGGIAAEPLCAPPEGWEEEGERLRLALTELGPTFIKLGQLLSQRPDIVPPPIIAELQTLQAGVAPMSFDEVSESVIFPCDCISEETGERFSTCKRLEDVFDEIDKEPIASGSIAQIYHATLNGNEVAAKILKPGIDRVIDTDLKLLALLLPFGAKLLRVKGFDAQLIVDELSTMLKNEIDMRLEALHIERFLRIFKDWETVVIPRVYWEYTNNQVIVMDFIKGKTVSSRPVLDDEQARYYANLITKAFLQMVYVEGFYHADPHSGNIVLLDDGKIALLDFGAVGRLREEVKLDALEVFYAFYQGDVSKALKGFLRLVGVTEREIDVDAFYADLDELVEKFQAARYSKGQGDNLARLSIKYGLPAPRAFIVLERAILLVEGVCDDLYRYFDIREAMAEQFSVESLIKAELKRGYKRFSEASIKLVRNLPDIVDRYVEGDAHCEPEPTEQPHVRSNAPYVIAALLALIGVLFPLCSAIGALTMSVQFMLYVPITALVLAALVTIVTTFK